MFHGGALRAQKRQYADLFDASESAYRQTVLAAFENVADTLVLPQEEISNALTQARRAADAAPRRMSTRRVAIDWGLFHGRRPWQPRSSYQSARVTLARARAARLGDTASLFQAMGEIPSAPHGGLLRD